MLTREKQLLMLYALGFFVALAVVSIFYLLENNRSIESAELPAPTVSWTDLF